MRKFVTTLGFLISITCVWVWWVYNKFILTNQWDSAYLESESILMNLIIILFMPIVLIWMVFGFVYLAFSFHYHKRHFLSLMYNAKKNTEYTEVIVRSLLESREKGEITDFIRSINFVLYEFSEILTTIISKTKLANDEVLSRIWEQNIDFKIWALTEIILEQYNNRHNFTQYLKREIYKNESLKALVIKYNEKYKRFIHILGKYDNEKIVRGFFEEGNLGKVNSIFVSIEQEVKPKNESENKKETELSFFDKISD